MIVHIIPDNLLGRPLREGVDRNPFTHFALIADGRPLREGVDRNGRLPDAGDHVLCRPLREGVDRNLHRFGHALIDHGRPLREGVDRNCSACILVLLRWVALYVRAWIEIFFDGVIERERRVALYARAWIEIS